MYVSRTVKLLQGDGKITLSDDHQLRIIDAPAPRDLCDFIERYQTMDTS